MDIAKVLKHSFEKYLLKNIVRIFWKQVRVRIRIMLELG